MGLFWDLMQQRQIGQPRQNPILSKGILRVELRETQCTLHEVITRLEQHFGKDYDRDGRVGG